MTNTPFSYPELNLSAAGGLIHILNHQLAALHLPSAVLRNPESQSGSVHGRRAELGTIAPSGANARCSTIAPFSKCPAMLARAKCRSKHLFDDVIDHMCFCDALIKEKT
jgi:hypothetical protein